MSKQRKISYTTILHEPRLNFQLSLSEYCIADMIFIMSSNPESIVPGWCYAKRQVIADYIGISKRAVQMAIKKLIEKGLVKKHEELEYIKTTQKWYDNVVCFGGGENLAPPVQEPTSEGVKILHPPREKSAPPFPYNNNINKDILKRSLSSGNDDKKNDNDDSFFKNIKKQYAEKYDIEALLFEARCRLDRRKEKGDIANPVGYLKITVKNMLAEELEKYSLEIRKQKADEEKKEIELIQQQEQEVLKQNSKKKRIEEKIEQLKKKRIQTELRTPQEADTETYLSSLTKFQRKIAKSDITADQAFIAWYRSQEIGNEINFLEKNLTKEEFEYYISSVDLEQ